MKKVYKNSIKMSKHIRITGLVFLIFVFLISCKKSDKTQLNTPPAETKTTYSLDSASTQPGFYLTLKASDFIKKDTCTLQIGGKPILLTQIDSSHYVFSVPVLNPGTYKLDLKNLHEGNTLDVVIRNYTSISNSDDVIKAVIKNYNNLADSLVKNSLINSVKLSDANFMHQLMDQLSQNIQKCSTDEKLLLAYQIQNMNLNNTLSKNANLDTAYLARRTFSQEDEIARIMTVKAIDAERIRLQAFLSGGAVAITAIVASKSPNLYTGIAFLVSLANYGYSINSARKAAGEAVDIIGIAENDINEVNGNGTNVNPIVVSIGKTLLETFQGTFRTLRKSDEGDALNNEISTFIKGTYELEKKDNTIKSLYDNIKSKLSGYFDKITINYSAYVSPVLAAAIQKKAKLKSEFISVTNVSNPDITVAAVADGVNNLKLTFNNPSNNIVTKTDFTFQLTFTQQAINNKVTITEQGKFNPLSLPKVTTTIVGSITATTASSGGIITDDSGGTITAKGLCWSTSTNPTTSNNKTSDGTGTGSFTSSITNLTANTTYYVRAYATNSAGTAYGNEVSFKTISPSSLTQTSWSGSYKADGWASLKYCPSSNHPEWKLTDCSAPMTLNLSEKDNIITGSYTMWDESGSVNGKRSSLNSLELTFLYNRTTTVTLSGSDIGSKMSGHLPAVYNSTGNLAIDAISFEISRIK